MRPLKITLFSPAFFPMLGGLETVVQLLAEELTYLGQEVTVVTNATYDQEDDFNFTVLRRPGCFKLIQVVRNSDVYLHANVSLWGLIPFLLCGWNRPRWVATHHGWYENYGQPVRALDRLKRFLSRFASANISVSQAVDRYLGLHGHVIPNPYESSIFHLYPEVPRKQDLIFVGRLVSDKGVDVLLDALAILAGRDQHPLLTIVGTGPEETNLRAQSGRLGLSQQVSFVGSMKGEALARLMNAHKVMVVPSRWNEPFGIVALEGIACGCIIVGSSGGGLPEAIGPCGLTYSNGDPQSLALLLQETLTDVKSTWTSPFTTNLHLKYHKKEYVAQQYLAISRKCVL